MFLNANKLNVLTRVMDVLAEPQHEAALRLRLGQLMLQLLGAQYYGSRVWEASSCRFTDCLSIGMDPHTVALYEQHYQFCDPITPPLQRYRRAVRVVEVMTQADLKRTEYFNDLLCRDGLYWGINLYAWCGNELVGDMCIWRDRRRDNFTEEEARLLDIVRPAFASAIRRSRGQSQINPPPAPTPGRGDNGAPVLDSVLSKRELGIASMIGQGQTDKEIALLLGISVTTVRTHVDRTFKKLDVRNRVELALRVSQRTKLNS